MAFFSASFWWSLGLNETSSFGFLPSKNAFEKAGGWNGIGSVYYLDYSTGITNNVENINKEDLVIDFEEVQVKPEMIDSVIMMENDGFVHIN